MRQIGNKRERLVQAAADLSYARGLGKVSLADIASRADVPLGNVYYYFKTKAAIGQAVVGLRCDEFRILREAWEQEPSPQGRLKAFVRMTVDNRKALARAGCPVGSLCAELGKEQGMLSKEVALPFRQLLGWLEGQFEALGQKKDRKALAIHLLSSLQGVSLLANCFRDPALVTTEAQELGAWIDGLHD
jgi:TetR/AcrR family transcriptional regulator, transcriptional repressor for nem operon